MHYILCLIISISIWTCILNAAELCGRKQALGGEGCVLEVRPHLHDYGPFHPHQRLRIEGLQDEARSFIEIGLFPFSHYALDLLIGVEHVYTQILCFWFCRHGHRFQTGDSLYSQQLLPNLHLESECRSRIKTHPQKSFFRKKSIFQQNSFISSAVTCIFINFESWSHRICTQCWDEVLHILSYTCSLDVPYVFDIISTNLSMPGCYGSMFGCYRYSNAFNT